MSDSDSDDFDFSSKRKRAEESDDEEEFRESDSGSSESDSDMEEELRRLPKDLLNLSKQEKKELYKFKKTHNEMEYEAEIMRRVDNMQNKRDLERLKDMAAGPKRDEPPAKKPARSRVTKASSTKQKHTVIRSDEEEEDDEIEESEEEMYSSSDDDLFDKDEIEEYSKITESSSVKPISSKSKDKDSSKFSRLKRDSTSITARAPRSTPKRKSGLDVFRASSEADDIEEESVYSDNEGDSTIEHKDKSRFNKKTPQKEEDTSPLATVEDYQRIQTRRMWLEKWVTEPYFDDVVKGSFIRLFVGMVDGQQVYRMCEVVEVVPHSRPYKMPDTGVTVDRALLVGVGSNTKVTKMHHVSNSRITEREFQQYVTNLKNCRQEHALLRKNAVDARRARITATLHHTYTHEEIQSMVDKNLGKNKALTTNYANAVACLEKKLESARTEQDFDEMERLQKEIEKIQRDIKISKDMYQKKYSSYSDLNRRNREMNLKKDMEAGVRRKQLEASQQGDNKMIDPFARRDTRPKILWVTGKKDKGNAGTGGEEETKDQPEAAPPVLQKMDSVDEDDTSYADTVVDPEELGRKIEKKYGFNPWKAKLVDKRDKYLAEACAGLHPKGSSEREGLRSGISLLQYLNAA
mmetsp:Transcript_8850/g.13248  ORF Transcript_8850/g.13248 Transcript_8850/m.13248 type:complete len:634 (+) Transcript_8850:73-1974(+)